MVAEPTKVDSRSKTKKRVRNGFVVFSILALAVVFLAHWQPHADFDVIGILWLMQNIIPFAILCVLFAGATGALCVWLKCEFRDWQERRKVSAKNW